MGGAGSLPWPPAILAGACWHRKDLQALEDCCDALAATDAHGDQAVLPAGAVQLVDGLDGENAAGGADRMPQCDGPAVGVDLLHVEGEITRHRARLRGEC